MQATVMSTRGGSNVDNVSLPAVLIGQVTDLVRLSVCLSVCSVWSANLFQAAICRCSQPLSGFSARCVEDESLLQAIRKANTSSKYMFVVDMRPKVCYQLVQF